MCIYTFLSSFQRIWETRKDTSSHVLVPSTLVSTGDQDFTSLLTPDRPPPPLTTPPHPPLKGFSQVGQKGGFAKDLEGLEFLSGSRRCSGEKQQQHREEQLTGQPRHLFLTAPGHSFLLPFAHNTHPPPASCELGVRSRVALYHRNGSTISSVCSNLSPLA